MATRPVLEESDIAAAVSDLAEDASPVAARDWPGAVEGLKLAGLYSWWVENDGARDLSEGLGEPVPAGLVYAGQAGATKWPSGTRGLATLGSRIGAQHIGGRIRSSTFRLTLAAALHLTLGLEAEGGKRLTSASERELTAWIGRHLAVAVHPVADRDVLASLEDAVLARLDPPLNLQGRRRTPLRSSLKRARSELGAAKPNPDLARIAKERSTDTRSHTRRRKTMASTVTLHEEIAAILRGRGWMSTSDIAAEVNRRGNYRKRDGSAVTDFQIHGRTKNYGHIFERDGSKVRLIVTPSP